MVSETAIGICWIENVSFTFDKECSIPFHIHRALIRLFCFFPAIYILNSEGKDNHYNVRLLRSKTSLLHF